MDFVEALKNENITEIRKSPKSDLHNHFVLGGNRQFIFNKTGYYIENYFPEKNVRYVSILDGIDTFIDSTNNDVTPFKAIINDMYAKDISKKIRSVFKEKQKQGEYLCSTPAYRI